MERPRWTRPRLGQKQAAPQESRSSVKKGFSQRSERPPLGQQAQPPRRELKTFREELREARLRQEAARKAAMDTILADREPARKGETHREHSAAARSRRPVPKAKKKRRLDWKRALLLLASVALLIASYVLLHQPWLKFGRLQLTGSQIITMEDINNLGNIPDPLNIFNVDRKQLKQALEADYRVEKADISFGWPNVLRITVTDRKPALYVACEDGRFAKLDPTGHVIDVSNGIQDGTAPFFSGWSTANVDLGAVVEDEEIQGLLKFLGKMDESLRARIEEISIDDRYRIKIYLQNGVPIIIGTYENAEGKLDQFKAICQELEQKKIKAKYIDLTYEKPYIKLQ